MMKPKKKGGGSRLTRSEVVTVRLDPKLRYGAELAARKQRRTVSSFIEWAIEDALSRVEARPYTINGATHSLSIKDVMQATWDIDEPDRVVSLVFGEPSLLSSEEERIWKTIATHPHFWRGMQNARTGAWEWVIHTDNLIMSRVRQQWNLLKEIANGQVNPSSLPDSNIEGWPVRQIP